MMTIIYYYINVDDSEKGRWVGVLRADSTKSWARITEKQSMLAMLYVSGLTSLTPREPLHSFK